MPVISDRPNTVLVLERNEIRSVTFYHTEIIVFNVDGSIMLNNGGYNTPTTKERMNRYLPDHLQVYQYKHAWYVFNTRTEKRVAFEDNRAYLPADFVKGQLVDTTA